MYDAIVLAGGAARRLGGVDKPAVRVGDRELLARVLDAVRDARQVVVAGPPRALPRGSVAPVWCREQPPGGGPVAALSAAVPHTTADVVVVLAADLPWVAGAIAPLLAAVPDAGAALLTDAHGRVNYLAGAWRRRALVVALAAIGEVRGASMRALLRDVPTTPVADTGGWGADCDTWADVEAADAEAVRRAARL